MIVDKFVEVKISSSNYKYWIDKGYSFEKPLPKLKIIPRINVQVSDLEKGSNTYVNCICDLCNKTYSQRFCRNTDVCESCRKTITTKGNTYGKANKGKKLYSMHGENHPRWNPNKDEAKEYYKLVRHYTEKQPLHLLENFDKPRGLCGVEGAYQLDHMVSIKYGFENNIPANVIGNLSNLRFIPWKENNEKRSNNQCEIHYRCFTLPN
jgi:hypothetical protein